MTPDRLPIVNWTYWKDTSVERLVGRVVWVSLIFSVVHFLLPVETYDGRYDPNQIKMVWNMARGGWHVYHTYVFGVFFLLPLLASVAMLILRKVVSGLRPVAYVMIGVGSLGLVMCLTPVAAALALVPAGLFHRAAQPGSKKGYLLIGLGLLSLLSMHPSLNPLLSEEFYRFTRGQRLTWVGLIGFAPALLLGFLPGWRGMRIAWIVLGWIFTLAVPMLLVGGAVVETVAESSHGFVDYAKFIYSVRGAMVIFLFQGWILLGAGALLKWLPAEAEGERPGKAVVPGYGRLRRMLATSGAMLFVAYFLPIVWIGIVRVAWDYNFLAGFWTVAEYPVAAGVVLAILALVRRIPEKVTVAAATLLGLVGLVLVGVYVEWVDVRWALMPGPELVPFGLFGILSFPLLAAGLFLRAGKARRAVACVPIAAGAALLVFAYFNPSPSFGIPALALLQSLPGAGTFECLAGLLALTPLPLALLAFSALLPSGPRPDRFCGKLGWILLGNLLALPVVHGLATSFRLGTLEPLWIALRLVLVLACLISWTLVWRWKSDGPDSRVRDLPCGSVV